MAQMFSLGGFCFGHTQKSKKKKKNAETSLLSVKETLQPIIDMFCFMVSLISGASLLPTPADIQGQEWRTTGGLSVTERCSRLALPVTVPLIPSDRCEECSSIVGRSLRLLPSPTTGRAFMSAHFYVCHLSFCSGVRKFKVYIK